MSSEWPPSQDSLISVKINDKIYNGFVVKLIWNNTAVVIDLIDDNTFIDPEIIKENLFKNPEGYKIISSSNEWKYLTKRSETVSDIINDIIKSEITKSEITKSDKGCDLDDVFPSENLLVDGNINMNDLFDDGDINLTLMSNTSSSDFVAPSSEVMQQILDKLNEFVQIPDEQQKIIVNKTLAIKNLINTQEDEVNEGNKIINWIKDNMMTGSDIFLDLNMIISNGYVHIARKGLSVIDTIRPNLIPDLKIFKWQYDIPIDYNSLKYVMFQNKIQQKINKNFDEQIECEKILSQEYLIALQPLPKYQMWCLKRLIMCWYGDVDLQNNIRKIKVLVNQYRATDGEFNKKNGILPSIVIYPRYGKNSARLVLLRIGTYFLYYNSLGWECSKPTYFINLNKLLWYTNGITDLKLYYRRVKQGYTEIEEDKVFEEKYSLVKGAEKILY
jgi:hypothetical protein